MTKAQYCRKVRRLSAMVEVPVGFIRAHRVPVSWCGKHRNIVGVEVAAHPRNIYASKFQPNLQDGPRITRDSIEAMRTVMPEIDPENRDWWLMKAAFHEGRLL